MESNNQAILDMIARYKSHLREHGLKAELYKWDLIERFKGRPNVDAVDLLAEISEVNFGNLLYQMAKSVMKDLAHRRTDAYRQSLRRLLNEEIPIDNRIQRFFSDTLVLYREIVPEEKYGHHQDERTAGLLLVFHYPDRYAIYKDSFYKKFCKLLGIKHKWKGEKFGHFQTLIKEFIDLYVSKDLGLLKLMQDALPDSAYKDPNHLLLAQNILYTVLDQGMGIELEDEEDEQESAMKNEVEMSKSPLNQILYGPPGTGKTYHTINHALKILGLKGKDREEEKRLFEEKVNAGQIAFVTFHQSMSYEDFVEGIKPNETVDQQIGYSVEDGLLKRLSKQAFERLISSNPKKRKEITFEDAIERLHEDWISNKEMKFEMLTAGKEFTILRFTDKTIYFKKSSGGLDHSFSVSTLKDYFHEIRPISMEGLGRYYFSLIQKLGRYVPELTAVQEFSDESSMLPHILIIDEINRGNVSQIFGELITLIEEDKRAGKPEALSVTLPYSKDSFSVPPNLYIIGTMNTADRSVEALDTALRRRFEFVEMAPDPNLLRLDPQDATSKLLEVGGFILRDLLYTINLRIEKLLDRDHQIGHAYFMGIKDLEGLKIAFQHKLLPLLQEYFFGDYSKIGLVLGKGFVHKVQSGLKADEIFAPFESEYRTDLAQREVWHLRNIESMSPEAFLAALDALRPMDFLA